MGPL
jgi:hypothetical protein